MNYEHEKGKKALELCLNMHHIKDEELVYIGLTREDITQIKNGNKYMTEDQLYNFAFVMRSPNMIQRPLVDWLNCGDLWALAGIAEPTFSLNNISIRAIMDFPYVFIIILMYTFQLMIPSFTLITMVIKKNCTLKI